MAPTAVENPYLGGYSCFFPGCSQGWPFQIGFGHSFGEQIGSKSSSRGGLVSNGWSCNGSGRWRKSQLVLFSWVIISVMQHKVVEASAVNTQDFHYLSIWIAAAREVERWRNLNRQLFPSKAAEKTTCMLSLAATNHEEQHLEVS